MNALGSATDAVAAALEEAAAATTATTTTSSSFPTDNDITLLQLASSGQVILTDDLLAPYVALASRTGGVSSSDALAYYQFLESLIMGYEPYARITVPVEGTESSTESFYRPPSIGKYYEGSYTLCYGRHVPMNAASGAGGTGAVYMYSDTLIGTDGVRMDTTVSTGVILGPFAYRISSNGGIQVRLGDASSDFSSLPLIYQLDAYEDYPSVNTVSITHNGPSEQAFEPEHQGTGDHTNYEPEEPYIVTGEDGIFEGQTSLDGSILYLDDLETAAPVLVDRIRQARENNPAIRVRAWGKDPIVEPSWYVWSTGQDTFVANGGAWGSYAYSRTSGTTMATDLSDEPMSLGEFSIIVAGATVATVLAILVVKGVLGGGDSTTVDNRVHLVLDKQ